MIADVTERLWQQLEPMVFITREQFVGALAAWEIEPVVIDDQLAFAWLTHGPEFHFASFDTGATITRGMIRSRVNPLLERHGFAVTRTPKDGADRQHRFNRAFGLRAFGEDEFFLHYKMERPCR